MNDLKKMVLRSFKILHRTRMRVFESDQRALIAARIKINEAYNKNKHVNDKDAIREMVKFAEDIERELRTQVIQAREVKPGVFEAKITGDTVKLENLPYDDTAIPTEGVKGVNKCCQDQIKNK